MSAESAQLLQLLGAGVRPDGASARVPANQPGMFASLLETARAGELSTGRPVDVLGGLDVSLSESQHAALSGVVDKAESAGATFLLVHLGDQALTVDVLNRRIVSSGGIGESGVLTGIDGFARIDTDGEIADSEAPRSVRAGGLGVRNPELWDILAGARGASESG